MAYTLNTGHALYPNLVELIGVQGGALVSHKTARTFTKHAEASYGTGTYGEHFTTVGGGFTAKGASFSPSLTVNTTTSPNWTLVAVVNSITSAGGNGKYNIFGQTTTTGAANSFSIGLTSAALPQALSQYNTSVTTGTTDLDATASAHMLAISRTGETSHFLYVDGSIEGSGTRLGFGTSSTFWDYIGGTAGQGSVASGVVWLAWFNKALTETELDDLYSSLGANNSFGLLEAPGTNISCSIGNSSAVGYAASILAATSIACSIGSASSVGYQASVSVESPVSISCALGTASAFGYQSSVSVSGSGTIVTEPIKNNTGTLLASQTGATAFVYDVSTGDLVVAKTGQSTDSSGVMAVSDALIVPATQYRVVVVLSGGAEGLAKYTAS